MNAQALSFRSYPRLWGQALALLIGGCALLLVGGRPLYLLGLGVCTAVGCLGLVRCVLWSRDATIWDIALVSLCLGYGLGTLNTELTWIRQPIDYLSLTAAQPTYIIRSTGWLMILGAAFCAMSGVDSQRVFADVRIPSRYLPWCWALVLGIALAAVVQVATGAIGYHQDMTDGGVSVSPLAALTVSAICPAAALASFVVRDQVGWRRWLLAAGLLILMLIQFYQGRRVFIYSTVLCLMCFFASNPPKSLISWRNAMTLGLAALSIVVASKAFFALRMAMLEMGSSRDTVALLQKGMGILFDSERSGLNDEVTENQNSRTFIIGYVAELVQALEDHEPLYGQVLLFDAALNVPSALWPGKYKVVSLGAEESVANPHFGLLLLDEANSIVTTGLSDLGIAGLFVYPLGLLALYRVLLKQGRRLGGLPYLFLAAALINTLLNVEAATSDYFSILRSLALIAAASGCVLLLWRLVMTPIHAEAV